MAKQQSAEVARTLPDHDQCDTHWKYKLSCEQYERLLARSGQLCEIDRKSVQHTQTGKLNIDHSGPWWAVRGLLCTPCNTALRNGSAWLPGAAEYLANTWWLQECRRLGLPSSLGDEPGIGSAIRDQCMTVWIRYADDLWHPHGGRTNGAAVTWRGIFDMRGPQNMVPFDVYGPGVTEMVRWYADRERQAVARERTAAEAQEREAAAYERGRLEFARELLAGVSVEERNYYLEMADLSDYDDEWSEAEDEHPQTEAELACSAVDGLLNSVRCDWDYLVREVEESLGGFPSSIGARASEFADRKRRKAGGPYNERTFWAVDALQVAEDLANLPTALEFLGTMSAEEQEGWRSFARHLFERADLDEDRLTARAAHCAEVILAGNRWASMCTSKGDDIPVCTERSTHVARISEVECCGPDGPEDHKGHGVCDRHLAELVAGTYVGRTGKTRSAVEHAAIGPAPWDF